MTLDELKAEVLAAKPEVRTELYTLLWALRRRETPGRAEALSRQLDDPQGWISEEDAARRLGLDSSAGQ